MSNHKGTPKSQGAPSHNPLQKTASLHEKAVQAVADGSVQETPQGRQRRPQGPPAAITTHHIRVDPELWAQVQRIVSEGIYTKVEIRSETEVVVR